MRKISKESEPSSLTQWRRDNPVGRYNDLGSDIRKAIRLGCLNEQFYICAYCCQPISGDDDCVNEHVEAQAIAPNRSLDYNNIVASCKTRGQCDSSHGAQRFDLTPFMAECETEFLFKISGRVEGLTPRAKKTIQVLNLGDHEKHNRRLIEKRKALSEALLWTNGIDPVEGLEDEELLESVIEDLQAPIGGKLSAYAPVVVNILRDWITI